MQGLGLRVKCLGLRVEGLGFRVQGLGSKVWGLGFMVPDRVAIADTPGCGLTWSQLELPVGRVRLADKHQFRLKVLW